MAEPLALFDGHANSYDPQADRRTMDREICDPIWWPFAAVGGHQCPHRRRKWP